MIANPEFIKQFRNQNILVAPLNWGLGHAARCLPIIQYLSRTNKVTVASDGLALDWLKLQCGEVQFLELPSYNVRYENVAMWRNMVRHAPGMLRAIKNETKLIENWAIKHPVDVIISDHRLGVRHPDSLNIFMAHQLTIPHSSWMVQKVVSIWQAALINKFDRCWIPDHSNGQRLSGQLSQQKLKIPKLFIGPLSKFDSSPCKSTIVNFDLAVVLSGAEPARTAFEELLVQELYHLNRSVVFIRGTYQEPSKEFKRYSTKMKVINLASSTALYEFICSSSVVLSRTGYSTLMDLDVLGKKAILVPTPGQPEQEYLAKLHAGRWFMMDQDSVTQRSLEEALRVLSK